MGFSTILDILGATVIGGLLLLILLRLNGSVTENTVIYGNDRSLQRSLAETAVVVEEDLRKMGYCADPFKLTDGMSRVIYADSSYISFYTDVDLDGNLDSLAYFISDTTALSVTRNPRDRILYRQINTGTPFIVNSNIVQFKLTYFDALGFELSSPVASPSMITHLEISFKVEDPEAYDQLYSEAYWQQVRLTSRNLRKR
jgi:hypothetical protein